MEQTRTYAHGVEHTRPIHASGRHIGDAANEPARDFLAGIPRTVVSGSDWRLSDRGYWRQYAANCGECPYCGMRNGRHEAGCENAPDEGDDE